MIQDQWRTGRTPENMEDNFGPSMVEPCYNPSIQDYLNNPSLVARKGLYDNGKDVPDDLPDPWNDEPLYTVADLPVRNSKSATKKKKGEAPLPNEEVERPTKDADAKEEEQSDDDDKE